MSASGIAPVIAGVILGLGVLVWLREEPSPRRIPPPVPSAPARPAPPLAPSAPAQGMPSAAPAPLAEAPEPAAAAPAPPRPAAAPGAGLSYRDLRGEARLAYDRYHREPPGSQAREEALFELAMAEQPAVLPFLLEEYRRVEPEERELVLGAVIQFGSRDAVPTLRELAQQADSLDEEVALTEAAEFLEMMSLTEYIEQRQGKPGADERN